MDAKLIYNPNPESDGSNWSTPKVDLKVNVGAVTVSINRKQCEDLLLFLDARKRMTIAERFLKYRPNCECYKDNYKKW